MGVRAAAKRPPSLLLGLWLWRAECCTTTLAVAVPVPLGCSSATASSAALFFFPIVGLARAAHTWLLAVGPGTELR